MRLFIALNIPGEVRKKLYGEAKILEEKDLFTGKIIEEENLHLTLKFLGEVEESKLAEIKEKLAGIKEKKIDAFLGELGVFDEKFIRIIWIRLLGADELQKKVDSALSKMFARENRFMSNITIARVKSAKERRRLIDEIKNIKLTNIKFKIESFELMKSELTKEGARYSVIESYNLL